MMIEIFCCRLVTALKDGDEEKLKEILEDIFVV